MKVTIAKNKFKKPILPNLIAETFQKWFLSLSIIAIINSCASLGSKTLYVDKSVLIEKPTKVALAPPTFINCIGGQEENYNCAERYLNMELTPYNISIVKQNISYKDFDNIGYDSTAENYRVSDEDFLMFVKVTRLTAMGQTRDYKVEYKLVASNDNKLKFHSKYNSTVGGTVVVIPGIKDFPNSDEMMVMSIRSGLYEFKKNLLKQ